MNTPAFNRMSHSSSFALSCILNLLLFLTLLHWAGTADPPPPPDGVIKLLSPGEKIKVTVPPPDITEPRVGDDDEKPLGGMDGGAVTFEPPTPRPTDGDTNNPDPSRTELKPIFGNNVGTIQIQGLLGDRGGERREAAEAKYLPQSVAGLSEPAVLKALDWLQAHQHENGGWTGRGDLNGSGVNAGYTGLALLTFLAHGETPASKVYGETVARAIRFLVEHQDANGIFRPAGRHTAYGHALATYALAEAYLMTDNPLLHDPVKRAARAIMEGQMPGGGFDYDYKIENRNDLSLGGWHVQALAAVMMTPAGDAEVAACLQRAMDGMLLGSKKLENGGRGFTYNLTADGWVDAPRRIITAAGALGLHLSGRGRSREARESMVFLEQFCETDRLPRWGDNSLKAEHGGEIMFWYYAVQAFFKADPDGRHFKRFVHAMVIELTTHQQQDGRWTGYTENGIRQGPVYNTALGALSLMTCYRHSLKATADKAPGNITEDPDAVTFGI